MFILLRCISDAYVQTCFSCVILKWLHWYNEKMTLNDSKSKIHVYIYHFKSIICGVLGTWMESFHFSWSVSIDIIDWADEPDVMIRCGYSKAWSLFSDNSYGSFNKERKGCPRGGGRKANADHSLLYVCWAIGLSGPGLTTPLSPVRVLTPVLICLHPLSPPM